MLDQINPASEFNPCSIFNGATKNSSVPRNNRPDTSIVNIFMYANINLQFIAHVSPSWIANIERAGREGEREERKPVLRIKSLVSNIMKTPE